MKEYLKWWLFKKEMQELESWQICWQQYRQWLSEFEIVRETLDNMRAEVLQEPRKYPFMWDFREYLRKKYKGE